MAGRPQLPEWGPKTPSVGKPFGGALPFGMPGVPPPGGYPEGPRMSNYAKTIASSALPANTTELPVRYDAGGPGSNLDYMVAHGKSSLRGEKIEKKPSFILVKNAGTGEADGVYKPAGRRWEGVDVYANRYGDCIISREAHKSPKTGEKKYGFVLGKDGRPLYGAKTEKTDVPGKGWKAFQGYEPAPEVQVFNNWSDCCQNGAWYFADEASNAAKGSHWKVVLLMADRAFDCHTCARPKGRGDIRNGGLEWCAQLCDLLSCRADALLHLGDFKKALVDACAAVHFVPAFEWSKAQTRGVTACLNLGVEEEQAKLLMAEFSRRSDREFPGVQNLEPTVDEMLANARRQELKPVDLKADEPPDDGRIYFRVVDPEDCKLYGRPRYDAKIVGERKFNDIIRVEQVLKDGTWLELHVSEEYNDSRGELKAYVPVFTEDTVNEQEEEDREEIVERLKPKEYPRRPLWEQLGLEVKPFGLKPPTSMEVPFSMSRWKDPPRDKNQKEWPYIYKHGLAIATMLRGAPLNVIDSFIRYHWSTGFNHIFLFFDDPEDPGIALAQELEELCTSKKVQGVGLSIHRMDAAWWEETRTKSRFFLRREKSDMYDTVCKLQEKSGDVESKQVIAIDRAITQAHEMGIDWFAHIDVDECIYVPRRMENSARRFLGALPRSVECVRLFNHEAVPEKLDCVDWFRECTLFRINKAMCQGFKPKREYDAILRQREGKEFETEPANPDTKWFDKVWAKMHIKRQKTAKELGVKLPGAWRRPPLDEIEVPPGTEEARMAETFCHFAAYECGKSIVRLDKHLRPALPYGPHSFLQDSGDLFKEYKQCDDAVVLHYPNACISHWREKYEMLGGVPYTKHGQPNPMRLHLASSEVVLHREKDEQKLFYKTFIMQSEHSELATLAEYGILQRIEAVRDILAYIDEEHEPAEVLPGRVKWYAPNGVQFGK
mmetsp:Transcript_155961/g.283665  ORF Transcript_155961/g.283665 Transcript_155961/m.283665 type:complete len:944 (+) Transcript_155961:70-2901(+)